jgi:hypothetical protein
MQNIVDFRMKNAKTEDLVSLYNLTRTQWEQEDNKLSDANENLLNQWNKFMIRIAIELKLRGFDTYFLPSGDLVLKVANKK